MSTELVPFEEVQKLATAVAKSKLFKAFDNAETALVLMMVAQAEGCHPIQATQRYDVISGKPAKKADAMLADFQQRNGKVTWKQLDDQAAEGEFMCPGLGAPVVIRWTIEMAKKAGLTEKGTWKQYPRAMLRSRVVSEGVRSAMPGVVAGLYTPEEVQDFDATPVQTQPQASTHAPVVIEAQVVPPAEPPTRHKASKDEALRLMAALDKLGITTPGDAFEGDKKALQAFAKHATLQWVNDMRKPAPMVNGLLELYADEIIPLLEKAKAGEMPQPDPLPEFMEGAKP